MSNNSFLKTSSIYSKIIEKRISELCKKNGCDNIEQLLKENDFGMNDETKDNISKIEKKNKLNNIIY